MQGTGPRIDKRSSGDLLGFRSLMRRCASHQLLNDRLHKEMGPSLHHVMSKGTRKSRSHPWPSAQRAVSIKSPVHYLYRTVTVVPVQSVEYENSQVSLVRRTLRQTLHTWSSSFGFQTKNRTRRPRPLSGQPPQIQQESFVISNKL
jgi:hypothetical protein